MQDKAQTGTLLLKEREKLLGRKNQEEGHKTLFMLPSDPEEQRSTEYIHLEHRSHGM